MRVLLDSESVTRGLRRVAGEIVERHGGVEDLVLIGIRRGGISVARELLRWLRELERRDVPFGTLDITLYRDDAATALPNPRIGPSEVPLSLDGRRVVLVDDVLYTGRTVRAAIDALMDYGRPQRIELAVLVERSGRELPIRADYSVRSVELEPDERVDVLDDGGGVRAVVQPVTAPSLPPGPASGPGQGP
jgi:pyrimidine operon attenuation protein/uracil phosphoribosyltransferase